MNSNKETVTLTKIKFATIQHLSRELIDAQVDIEAYPDYFLIIGKGYLWGEDADRREVSFPKDWWQAFKKRWMPEWYLERWPVKYTIVVMDAKLVYTKLRPSLPKEPHILTISKWNAT